MSSKIYRHTQLIETTNGYLEGLKFFMTAKNTLPIEFFNGSGSTATFTMAYDKIDDLMLCCDIIPINTATYRIFCLAAFLPSAIIKEVMPEMSMNALGLTKNNTLYYRYDGKNANGKIGYSMTPMGGGGYGSIVTTAPASGIKAVWLSNYGSDPTDITPNSRGFLFSENNFGTYTNSYISAIQDLALPNAVITQAVIYQDKEKYFEHLRNTYNLEWYEQLLNTSYSRIKDPKQKQLVLDNLLICASVTSQVSYNSNYRLLVFAPQYYSVSPINNSVRAWQPNSKNPMQFTDFEFWGNNIPAYFHFKFSTWPQVDVTTPILKSADVFFNDFGWRINAVSGTESNHVDIFKYMCNINTGWTDAVDNTNPNMNAEYIYRAAYSRSYQIVTGDIDFKSEITCPDSRIPKSMVNFGTAKKEIANLPILNFDYAGVIE